MPNPTADAIRSELAVISTRLAQIRGRSPWMPQTPEVASLNTAKVALIWQLAAATA